jgi:DNA-binding transcriptional MocR family regulator
LIDLHLNYPILPGQAEVLEAILRDARPRLELPPYAGWDDRRELAARWLSEQGYAVGKERVVLCGGGHHAVMVTLLALGLRGGSIAVSPLTYSNFKVQAASLGIDLLVCASDAHGMSPDALDRAAKQARAVYLMPTVHNPLGTVMPEARRRQICDVARRHRLMILEDDAYRFMDAAPPLPFATLAPELTFSVRSFTKEFAPWMKLSFLVFPEGHEDPVTTMIRVTSSGAAEIFAEATARLIASGELAKLVAAKRADAAERQVLARRILEGLPLRGHPTSYHLWVDLAAGVTAAAVAQELKERDGILVTPSDNFRANASVEANGLRIALGTVRDQATLGEALQRVRKAIAPPDEHR